MPIEIRQLVIRATVEEQSGAEPVASAPTERQTAELVALCVEQVLEILRREKER
jgi:hypothetical protein